jgi:uncharacterized Zn-finger protein
LTNKPRKIRHLPAKTLKTMTNPATSKPVVTVELLASDLNRQGGVFCPSPQAGMAVWNNHPKVFIDVGHTGSGKCAYCGTVYALKAGEHFAGH